MFFRFMRSLRALFFPRSVSCLICKELPEEGKELCASCYRKLARPQEPVCNHCGKSGDFLFEEDVCDRCLMSPPPYTKARAPFVYDEHLRVLVHELKYNNIRCVASELAADLAALPICQIGDVLVPVPLHPRRERMRGFNQARLLCDEIARHTGHSVCDALARKRYTKPQAKLSREKRLTNLQNAIVIQNADAIRGKRVLLVDDVMTTGSTVLACTNVLLAAGVKEVFVVTLATA